MPIPPPDWVILGAGKTEGLDLLGLRAPVQSVGNNLLNGLTSVTPKIRYLSLLAWIAWRYAEGRLPAARSSFLEFAAAQEAAMVMANLLNDSENGTTTLRLVGVGRARTILETSGANLPLEQLVDVIASSIYASAGVQLRFLFEDVESGVYGLTMERGERLARAFGAIVGRSEYGRLLERQRRIASVPRRIIKELSSTINLDKIPAAEKAILTDAVFPASPTSDDERRRLATFALLLWLSAKKNTSLDEEHLFEAARRPPRDIPGAFEATLDGWLDYQILDVLAVAHESVMAAVLEEVDRRRADGTPRAPSSEVIAALLGRTEDHDEALAQVGLLSDGESVRDLSFQEMLARIEQAYSDRQTFRNGLRRWRGGLSERAICRIALGPSAGVVALLPVAWCLASARVSDGRFPPSELRRVADRGEFARIGIRDVVMPKIREFSTKGASYLEVMAELIDRTVQQHLRIAWQRLSVQGQDVSVLVADMESWSRNNQFNAGRSESRLGVAIGWLRQLGLIQEVGITTKGQAILDRSLATLSQAPP